MRMLVCNCGGHEFVVFTGSWDAKTEADIQAPVYAACTKCGEDWNLETVFWVESDREVTP